MGQRASWPRPASWTPASPPCPDTGAGWNGSAPRGHDPQKPHTRNEVYVIAAGRGTFLSGGARQDFAPGDFLFVPAGMVHRFEEFSDDFAAWVMFYGPEGGELGTAKGTT